MHQSLLEPIKAEAREILKKVDLTPLTGKSVLVTGATGILGTYLVACLTEFGKCHRVFCLSKNNPSPFEGVDHDYRFMPWDSFFNETFSGKIDYIVHAAGYGQPSKFTSQPSETLKLNTQGLMCLLDMLPLHGRLLFLSTSEVYSGCENTPFKVSDIGNSTPQHPRACYIEAKRCGEAICGAFNKTSSRTRAIAARVSLSYGPGTRKDDERVINDFIRSALLNRGIRLKDQGSAFRKYGYVTDAVEFLLNMLIRGTKPVYNVGGISPTSVVGLAESIGKYCNVPVVAPVDTMLNASHGAPDRVSIDMSESETEFGKTDYVSLEEGLARTIEWQKLLYTLE